jgi:hypothetical protein
MKTSFTIFAVAVATAVSCSLLISTPAIANPNSPPLPTIIFKVPVSISKIVMSSYDRYGVECQISGGGVTHNYLMPPRTLKSDGSVDETVDFPVQIKNAAATDWRCGVVFYKKDSSSGVGANVVTQSGNDAGTWASGKF